MNQTLAELLEYFKEYSGNQLKSIEDISSKENKILFQKILYLSFLESLAKASYPSEKGAKKRFINFLENFTEWKEYNHYSIVHIAKNGKFSKDTLNFCQNEVTKLYDNVNLSMSIENLPSLPQKYIQKEKQSLLNSCTYSNILYSKTRNNLVHQFQDSTETGMKFESIEYGNSPFFTKHITLGFDKENNTPKKESEHIELIFSNSFLKKLAIEGLTNFIIYCEKNNLNPFSQYYAERILHEKKL